MGEIEDGSDKARIRQLENILEQRTQEFNKARDTANRLAENLSRALKREADAAAGFSTEKATERVQILREAAQIISKDRNSKYGEPEDNFADIAKMFEVILKDCVDPEDITLFVIPPHKIAACMIAVKLCRINQSPGARDHWVDMAGYSGCGYECVLAEEYEKNE